MFREDYLALYASIKHDLPTQVSTISASPAHIAPYVLGQAKAIVACTTYDSEERPKNPPMI